MSPARRLVVHAAILLVVGCSLFEIAVGGEAWPFSSYQLYSTSDYGSSLRRVEVVGRGIDGREFLLTADRHAFAPLDRSRLRVAIERMRQTPDAEARLARAARHLFERYRANYPAAPSLSELRIEEVRWRFDRLGGARIDGRERLAAAAGE